jgi:hypothetical protein
MEIIICKGYYIYIGNYYLFVPIAVTPIIVALRCLHRKLLFRWEIIMLFT